MVRLLKDRVAGFGLVAPLRASLPLDPPVVYAAVSSLEPFILHPESDALKVFVKLDVLRTGRPTCRRCDQRRCTAATKDLRLHPG